VSLDRRLAWLVLLGSGAVFLVLAAVLVPWEAMPGSDLTPVSPDTVFSAEELRRAEAFSSLRRYLGWASYFTSLGVALLLGFTGLGASLVRKVAPRRWWLAVPVATLALLLLGRMVTFPLSVWSWRHRLAYGLTEQSLGEWAVDYLKSFVVGWTVTTLLALMFLGLVRLGTRRWFVWAGAAAAGLTFAGSFLFPVVVEPVFNEFQSMQEGPFKDSVLDLAAQQGVAVEDVLVSDASRRTTSYNAYVSGLGGTHRVVVYDTLLDGMEPEQALVVIAHELAHTRHRDVLVGTGLGAVGAVAGVAMLALLLDRRRLLRWAGVDDVRDPAVLPLVLALVAVGSLLASPVQSAISRAVEARADRETLVVVEDPDTFIAMQRELTLASLNDPTPPVWSQFVFGTHPTVLQRIAMAQSTREGE
jgi:STE24 endopeptidase